jgi:hypothetical protein
VSLKVPYKKYPTPFAACGFFYSASIPVNIALPAKNSPRSKRFDAIIDSGASSCIFHAAIGQAIGLDIEKGELTQTMGIAWGNEYLRPRDFFVRAWWNHSYPRWVYQRPSYCGPAWHGWIL